VVNDRAEMMPCIMADRGRRLDPSENQKRGSPNAMPGMDMWPKITDQNLGVGRVEYVMTAAYR